VVLLGLRISLETRATHNRETPGMDIQRRFSAVSEANANWTATGMLCTTDFASPLTDLYTRSHCRYRPRRRYPLLTRFWMWSWLSKSLTWPPSMACPANFGPLWSIQVRRSSIHPIDISLPGFLRS
jgi:hypothetical protein